VKHETGTKSRRRRKRRRGKGREDCRDRFVAARVAKVTPYISQLDVPDHDAKEDARDAHRLAKRVLNSLARVDGQVSWLQWFGQIFTWEMGRYRALHDDKLRALVTGALKEHFQERVTQGSDSKALSVSTNQLSGVLNAIKSITFVNADALPLWVAGREGDPAVFSFRNGLVEIDMALAGHVALTLPDARWFSKNCFPFSLDLDARCPRWLNFLERVLPALDDRSLFQEIVGYCLIADTRYQKFFVLIGSGSNGKSVALTMLTELLGDENVSSVPIEDFADKFALESTVDKLANIVNEVEDSKRLPEGIIKKYVSAERITVTRKHLKDIQVKPTARLLLSTNEMPAFKDRSNGMSRRFVPLRFPISIPPEERDPLLVSKLVPELPGIFLWALDGLRRLHQRGDFELPEASQALIEEARPDRLSADVFLTEACEADENGWIPTEALYGLYRDWAVGMRLNVQPKGVFGGRIELVVDGAQKQREVSGERRWGYRGVRLKSQPHAA